VDIHPAVRVKWLVRRPWSEDQGQAPDGEGVEIVIAGGETNGAEERIDWAADGKSEGCSRRCGVQLIGRHQKTLRCELEQIVLRAAGILSVAVCGDQVAIRREDQAERAVQVLLIREDDEAGAIVAGPGAGVRNSKDFVVGGRGNVKNVAHGSYATPVGPTTNALGSGRDMYWDAILVLLFTVRPELVNGDVETRDGGAEHVRNIDLRLGPVVGNGQIPGTVQQLRIVQRGDEGPLAIEDLKRPLTNHGSARGVSHREVADHNEPLRQDSQAGVEADQGRRGKQRLLTAGSEADDRGAGALAASAAVEIRDEHIPGSDDSSGGKSRRHERYSIRVEVAIHGDSGIRDAVERTEDGAQPARGGLSQTGAFHGKEGEQEKKA